MNSTLKAVLIGAVVAVAVLGIFLPQSSVVERVVERLGTGGFEVSGNCVSVGGGAKLCSYTQEMAKASTTCAFRNTDMASSTLIRATARIRNSYGGGFGLEFGKSANVSATTTSLGYYSADITSGTTLQASTTAGFYTNNPANFSVGDYLNIKIGSSTLSNWEGTCSALFMSI